MQCPVCDVTLSISSREGIEIDFCPQCRGVWLDRGELDKIIERAAPAAAAPVPPAAPIPPAPNAPPAPPPGYERDRDERDRYRGDRDDRYDRRRDDDYYRRKKRRSFLEDLFDFD